MSSYHQELQRRIVQFADYLRKMDDRTHEEAEDCCFIIFDDCPPKDAGDCDSLTETAVQERELVLVENENEDGFDANTIDNLMNPSVSFPSLPDEGWREDDSQRRFVQFAFKRKWFCLDLPLQTLFRHEAEQILLRRSGFFYLRDKPQLGGQEEIRQCDPLWKMYIYGDEQSAAEDMAFIFFDLWKFPVDWQFYVTASAFSGDCRWERGAPLS